MHCECPQDCCREVARLREDNAALRRSAESFADLAERLNAQLQRERIAAATAAEPSTPFSQLAQAWRLAISSLGRAVFGRQQAVSKACARR